MIFEVGKTYKHNGSKEKMKIIAKTELSMSYINPCLIAELENGELKPIGIGEDYAENWELLKENK